MVRRAAADADELAQQRSGQRLVVGVGVGKDKALGVDFVGDDSDPEAPTA